MDQSDIATGRADQVVFVQPLGDFQCFMEIAQRVLLLFQRPVDIPERVIDCRDRPLVTEILAQSQRSEQAANRLFILPGAEVDDIEVHQDGGLTVLVRRTLP